jgi:hypothetical protein
LGNTTNADRFFVRTPLRPNRFQDNKIYDLGRYVAECSGSVSCPVMVFASSIRPNGYVNTSTSGTAAGRGKLKHLAKNLLSSGALSYNIPKSSEFPAEHPNLK